MSKAGIAEARLDEIRAAGARGELIDRDQPWPEPVPPVPGPDTGYYGQPLLKEPAWTREIPVYFFVGGVAGGAAMIGAIAALSNDSDPTLARDARWLAVGCAATSGVLLVTDLGRPERFAAMMRVFKPQSPMSVGAWTLLAFSGATTTAAGLAWFEPRHRWLRWVRAAADMASAALGGVLSTYTGVLLGVSAIPVWATNIKVLPFEFGVSALGSAGGVLELIGHRSAALDRIGWTAALGEFAAGAHVETRDEQALAPVRRGASGAATRSGGLLAGPGALAMRAAGRRRRGWRLAASAAAVAGALLLKVGWYMAGSRSARDPREPLALSR